MMPFTADPTRWGAQVVANGVAFRLWAPQASQVEVLIEDGESGRTTQPLTAEGDGVFSGVVLGQGAGTRYRYLFDQKDIWPDPASRFQPDGVHAASEVIDLGNYRWRDQNWLGIAQKELTFYELHVGTFTPEGTFAAAQEKLGTLRDLGITAVELMPVHDFPGRWNWGYDPAALWAPSRAYGRPEDLCAFVDAAHALGLAVFLDVVYNHFGPDGAYAVCMAPFLSQTHQTGWGQAINLDGQQAAGVRAFYIANACYWLNDYHLDGLRLDATFALIDERPRHFLAQLATQVAQLAGRKRILIAEDDRNLRRLVEPQAQDGYGLDGIWADDFHHLMRRIATGDTHGYYQDYPLSLEALGECIAQGWLFSGQHSRYWNRPRGTSPAGILKEAFVFCIQNHDQIGNRPLGDRLHHQVDLALYRALSSLLLFVPQLPLLFMGQEWAATTPFCYFTDHNAEIGRAVSEGRRAGFSDLPDLRPEDIPDPQAPETFLQSKLFWAERSAAPHAGILALYRDLLQRRRLLSGDVQVTPAAQGILLQRGAHYLALATAPDACLTVPATAAVTWHSEQPAYTAAPRAPIRDGALLQLPVAAAVWLEDAV